VGFIPAARRLTAGLTLSVECECQPDELRCERFGVEWRESVSVSSRLLAELTQIRCVGVLKHVRKDTKGHGRGDHRAGGAAPAVDF
jgi:hypothetical protein